MQNACKNKPYFLLNASQSIIGCRKNNIDLIKSIILPTFHLKNTKN